MEIKNKSIIKKEKYFDHDVNIGIIGRGKTVEESFVNAAKNMFSIMADLSRVNPKKSFEITFEESDVELAFVTWLNLLLAKANAENYIFSKFYVKRKDDYWCGEAFGEPWRDDMERGTDVKGATLTMLSVKTAGDEWEARCAIDV